MPVLAALALAIFMTWPLAPRMGSVARTGVGPHADPRFGNNADGLFSLWNVSWVARTTIADPKRLFDANIFFPHENTLAYSEANLVAGFVGIPAWWLTKNPYATLNFVILLAFATAWLAAYRLVLYLTDNQPAAAAAGVFFAFCPYVFAHTAHIQLMITGGIPLTMLLMHRLSDAPSVRRGAALGGALLVQALACAYYGIFAALMVGYAVLFFGISRSLYRNRTWWAGLATAAGISIAGVAPFFYPYVTIQQEEEWFTRTLQQSVPYSANLTSFLASPAIAHEWLLRLIADWPKWNEVMFPGMLPVLLGAAGLVGAAAWSRKTTAPREREALLFYGSLGALAVWASLGPNAGLYSVLYKLLPMFSLLRAPSRIAIVIVLCLAVPAAFVIRRLLDAVPARRRLAAGVLVVLAAIGDLSTRMPWERAIQEPLGYDVLAKQPRGALAEFPFYAGATASHFHTQYMLFSTSHWMPMINGYSDHTPPNFRHNSAILETFPSQESFDVLRNHRVRYLGVHWDMYGPRGLEIRSRLRAYRVHLRPLVATPRVTIYEILTYP